MTNPPQLALLSYNLKAAGFRVATAKDGDEALLAVAEQGPDVICWTGCCRACRGWKCAAS